MKNKNTRAGFTLIEILLVVGIMAMLAGIAGYTVSNQSNNAKISVTKITLKMVKTAFSEYELDYGAYPDSLDALVDPAKGPILDADVAPTDEWKRALKFKPEGGRLQVYSAGPDGAWGSKDDLRTP
ncbi:MAG: general secretion pathway protein G [Kiritimatiellia bacterium]|jgi:general secretion pathway protein G